MPRVERKLAAILSAVALPSIPPSAGERYARWAEHSGQCGTDPAESKAVIVAAMWRQADRGGIGPE